MEESKLKIVINRYREKGSEDPIDISDMDEDEIVHILQDLRNIEELILEEIRVRNL